MNKHLMVVVGSVNSDLLLSQERLPARGETLVATDVREEFGGKGANQAVQCARLGQEVAFIGAVGNDSRGEAARVNLEHQGVECRLSLESAVTGLGFVQILPGGEVHATIVRGANAALSTDWVRAQGDLFRRAGVVILQNEVPADVDAVTIELGRAEGALVVYNAAPARSLDAGLSRLCDYLVVNEEEASFLAGRALDSEDAVRQALPELQHYCARIVVTLGSAGSILAIGNHVVRVEAVPAAAVDTTGAGDAFVAAFAAALNQGHVPETAARFASAVAAQATLAVGAQTAMAVREVPGRDSVRAQGEDPQPAG